MEEVSKSAEGEGLQVVGNAGLGQGSNESMVLNKKQRRAPWHSLKPCDLLYWRCIKRSWCDCRTRMEHCQGCEGWWRGSKEDAWGKMSCIEFGVHYGKGKCLSQSSWCYQKSLKLGHEIPLAGHLGKEKTCQRRFYWPTIFKDTEEFCHCCPQCQKSTPVCARLVWLRKPLLWGNTVA